MKKSGAFPLPSPYFRSIWFENKVSWCALKSSFERKWLVNVCCKNDDEMRWILLAFQDWKQKTYETIMCLFDLASLFCNIWKYYKKGMPFIRDVITIILKLLVILCPGGKLIKWDDIKNLDDDDLMCSFKWLDENRPLTFPLFNFQYWGIFRWLISVRRSENDTL